MSILLLFRITAVLGLGTFLLWLSRGRTASARHLLCVATLGISLLLPLTPSFGAPPVLDALTMVTRSVAAAETAHPAPIAWLRLVWIAGAIAAACRYLGGVLYLYRKTRTANRVAALKGTMDLLPSEHGITVRLAAVSTPVVWGWFHPEILLPLAASTWPQDRLRLVLLHEMAHVKRRDTWAGLVVTAAKIVYWFHPLVWWLWEKESEERELACDDYALEAGAPAREYAALLVESARQLASPVLFGCAMASQAHRLRGRIMHILQFHSNSRPGRLSRGATLLVPVLLAGAGFILAMSSTATTPGKTYKVGGEVSAPTLIRKVEPNYTDAARDAKIQGIVDLAFVIDEHGVPHNVVVTKGLDAGLDTSAIHAVEQWRFHPATKGGHPVAVQVSAEIHFQLK